MASAERKTGRGCGRSPVIPQRDVRPLDEPGSWQTSGQFASFQILQALPAGWIRVQFAFDCDVPLRLELHAEGGSGLCLNRSLPTCRLDRNLLLRLDQPVASLRIDVIGTAPRFHLSGVRVAAVSGVVVLAHSLVGKLALLRKYGGPWAALGRGLRLLLQGRVRAFLGKLHKGLSGPVFDAGDEYDADQAYDAWRRRHALQPEERAAQRRACADWPDAPLLSVVLSVTGGDEALLRSTLASVRHQTWSRWELCLAECADTAWPVREFLQMAAREEPRIRLVLGAQTGDRVTAINAALERVQGDFVVFLEAHDELAEQALYRLARSVLDDPNLDLVISDEDQVDASGRHHNPFFKPGWSPEALLEQPILGASLGVRTSLVRDLGGLRSACADVAAYDLVLRIAARTPRVRHIPDILYHRRVGTHSPDGPLFPALAQALTDHLQETGRAGVVEPVPDRSGHRVRFHVVGNPLVSIVIPTAFARRRGKEDRVLVVDCVRSIRTSTSWKQYEIIVVASRALPADAASELARFGVTIVPFPQPFNFAAAINRGAAHTQGTQLLLLNDDTEVITPDWLESMLEYAQQPDIGAVGARLLFPHGRVQHTGVHLLEGKPLHAFYGYPSDSSGYQGSLTVLRNYPAVTGACLMTRRDLFQELGGLDLCFALDCNDIDYCLRIAQTGRRIVCTPYAQLTHHEAFTRRGSDTRAFAVLKARWGTMLERDPWYNPNFGKGSADCRIDPGVGPVSNRPRENQVDG